MTGTSVELRTSSLPRPQTRTVSRRALLRVLGLSGAAAALPGVFQGERSAAAQDIPITERRPATGPDLDQQLWDMEYDPKKIFAYVAEEIAYEAYPGVLRGAKGTRWGLAGNSVDQAVLLAQMLRDAEVEVRFAVGELDEEQAKALLASMIVDEATVRANAARIAAARPPDVDKYAALTDEQRTALASPEELRARLMQFADGEVSAGLDVLDKALSAAALTPEVPVPALPERERTQHVWVQYAAGADWVDLDPSMPGAEPGKAYAKQTETWDELPDDLYHLVRCRAVVEVNYGGAPSRSDALTYEARAADLVGVPLVFAHVQPNAYEQIGVSINGIVDGSMQYVPTMLAGGVGEVGDAVTVGAGGGILDVMGDGVEDGSAVGEWLEIDVVPVDGKVTSISREIFDRVGIVARAAGEIDLASLPPIQLLDDPKLGRVFLPLEAVWLLGVVGSGVPGTYFEQDYGISDIEADMAALVHGYHATRNLLQVEFGAPRGYRWYHNQPNITAGVLEPVQTGDTIQLAASLDLVHQAYGELPIEGTEASVHPRVMAGVLAHVAEVAGAEIAAAMTGEAPIGGSVSGVFEAATAAGVPIRTLAPGSTDVADLSVSDEAKVRIGEALAAGYVVIVPERAVTTGGGEQTGWWQIDPATGRTIDQMENGRGFSPIGEDTYIIAWGPAWRAIWAWRMLYFSMGIIIGFSVAMAILTYPN